MEVERLKRYKEKIDLIEKRLDEIIEWKELFISDEKSKLASYKAFQEIVEAIMDIVAMMVKDENLIPKDDYSNIDTAEDKKLLTSDLSVALRNMNGLRNRIIHEYNGLSDEIALESMENLFDEVTKFIEQAEKWLKTKNSKN